MFGVSLTELIVVFVLALVLFGPEQLPHIARQLGKLMGELRRGSDAVRREFYNSVYPPAQDVRRDFDSEVRELRTLKAELLAPPPGTNPIGRAPADPPASTSPETVPPTVPVTKTET